MTILLVGLLSASAADARIRMVVVNFDQDVQSTGQTGVIINGVTYAAPLTVGLKDDDARDETDSLIDQTTNFGTLSIGDTTLLIFSVPSVINSASGIGTQGTDVSVLIVESDILALDLDPKDASADTETGSSNTTGSPSAQRITVGINSSSFSYDPTSSDGDEAAAAGLWSAGLDALPGAAFVGATTIVIPHCVLDPHSDSSNDSNLGIGSASTDFHIPCLNPPGIAGMPVVPALSLAGVLLLTMVLLSVTAFVVKRRAIAGGSAVS